MVEEISPQQRQERDNIKGTLGESLRIDGLLFTLVMLAAIFFRFYHLDSLPPGLHPDAATNGLDAWRLWYRGGHTPFLANNGGRETLLLYIQSLSIALLGTTPLAVRLPTALIGTLTVGFIFWFTYWWGSISNLSVSQRRWLAFWAGLISAGSHWQVVVSRLGLRAVLVPALTLPMFWAVLFAWRNPNRAWFILAGGLLGGLGYTYSAARVLILVLGLALLPNLLSLRWSDPKGRQRIAGLLWLSGAAILVYLPMGWYIITHPGQWNNRPFSVAIWAYTNTLSELLVELSKNVFRIAGFFCCKGNPEMLSFGLPGRAAQDPILGLLLLLGLLAAFRRSTSLEIRTLWLWFGLGLLPGVLAIEAPHALRLIVAVPVTAILVAWGIHTLVQYLDRFSIARPILVWGLTGWLVVAGGLTFRDYFMRWPEMAVAKTQFHAADWELAQSIENEVNKEQTIYLPQRDYARPTLRYYLLGPFPPIAQASFHETSNAVKKLTNLSDVAEPATPKAWVRLAKNQAIILPPDISPPGRFPSQQESSKESSKELGVAIGPTILTRVDYPKHITPEHMTTGLPVTLFWQAQAPINEDYLVGVQLLDDTKQALSLNTPASPAKGTYPTPMWRPGQDHIPDFHQLQIPETLPVGRYHLAVFLFDPIQGKRIAVSPSSEEPETVFLGPLKVPPPPEEAESLAKTITSQETEFQNVATLLGYHLNGQPTESGYQLTPGQPLEVRLLWQAIERPLIDYTVFVHLLNPDGELVLGHDAQPRQNTYPTSLWEPGERSADTHPFSTESLPPGRYRLAVGLYDFQTGARVSIIDQGYTDDQVILDTVLMLSH